MDAAVKALVQLAPLFQLLLPSVQLTVVAAVATVAGQTTRPTAIAIASEKRRWTRRSFVMANPSHSIGNLAQLLIARVGLCVFGPDDDSVIPVAGAIDRIAAGVDREVVQADRAGRFFESFGRGNESVYSAPREMRAARSRPCK